MMAKQADLTVCNRKVYPKSKKALLHYKAERNNNKCKKIPKANKIK